MDNFGKAMKIARKAQKVTLKKLGEFVGKSTGYLSDIENGRKPAPKLDMVAKIEECLNISDNSLLILAAQARRRVPEARQLSKKILMLPKLSEALLKADEDLTENDFMDVMAFIQKRTHRRRDY